MSWYIRRMPKQPPPISNWDLRSNCHPGFSTTKKIPHLAANHSTEYFLVILTCKALAWNLNQSIRPCWYLTQITIRNITRYSSLSVAISIINNPKTILRVQKSIWVPIVRPEENIFSIPNFVIRNRLASKTSKSKQLPPPSSSFLWNIYSPKIPLSQQIFMDTHDPCNPIRTSFDKKIPNMHQSWSLIPISNSF